MAKKPRFDSLAFRRTLGCFATGVTVMMVRDPKGVATGITINSFTSVSLKPPLVLFCIDRKARSLKAFKKAEHFSVNILSADQQFLSDSFAHEPQPELPRNALAPDQQGCPILRGTLGHLICRTSKFIPAGDHYILLAEVVDLCTAKKKNAPLLYHRGGYRKIAK